METCPICCETIVDATEDAEGQEALLCEGACRKWLHRWCAGVHKDGYAALTSSEEPFVCPSCSLAEHRQLIKSLAETVESLKFEIQQLKRSKLSPPAHVKLDVPASREEPDQESVSAYSKEPVVQPARVVEQLPLPASGSGKNQPWQTVKPKRRNKGSKGPGADGKVKGDIRAGENSTRPRKHYEPRWLNVKDLNSQQHSKQDQYIPQRTVGDKPSEEIAGVRRIWGTMRGCSSRTVLTALQRLSTVANEVEVRRKFKKGSNNSMQWWFLVRGQEPVLQQLEQQWGRIQTQISWKLEHCHRPVSQSNREETSQHNVSPVSPPASHGPSGPAKELEVGGTPVLPTEGSGSVSPLEIPAPLVTTPAVPCHNWDQREQVSK